MGNQRAPTLIGASSNLASDRGLNMSTNPNHNHNYNRNPQTEVLT